MRVVFVIVCLLLSPVSAQEQGVEKRVRQEPNRRAGIEGVLARLARKQLHLKERWGEPPATLAEAHARLEQILTPESLALVDGMDSEDGMILSHHGFGTGMRNEWGLWSGSALAKYMEGLGFPHPDEMSGVILATFWCKRHGRDFRLEERAAEYREYRERQQNRVPKARAALRSRLMGLRFEKRKVPKVPIVVRNEKGVRVRFLCPFRDGVFLAAFQRGRLHRAHVLNQESYTDPNGNGRPTSEYDDFVHRGYCFDGTQRKARKMKPGEDFYTQGYYFDPADQKVHEICVPEVNEVYAAVVADERAWFGGVADGKFVVTGIGADDRVTVRLPQDDEMPDLGLEGQSLLAVYTKAIYRLEGRTWTVVHAGDMLLPRSSLPPQRHGDTVFFREEEQMGGRQANRLWWLTMGEPLHLSVLDRRLEVITAGVLYLRQVTSCSLTSAGDLWVCTGEYWQSNCLLRRSVDGRYSIATAGGSVRLPEDWPDARPEYEGAAVSAVRALPDETLLLAGRTGLYRLKGDELLLELAFALDRPSKWVKEPDQVVDHVTWRRQDGKMVKEVTKVVQKATRPGREVVSSVPWIPNTVLQLDDGSYFLGTDTWEGAYWIRLDDQGQWTCLSVSQGDPVEW